MKKESDDWDDIKVNRRSTDKVYFESPVIQSISDSIDFLRDETKEILKELDSTEFKQQIDEFDLEDFGEEAIDQISEIKDEISQFRAEIIDSDDVPEFIKESSLDAKRALNRDADYVRRAKRKLYMLDDGRLTDELRTNVRVIELCDKAIEVNFNNWQAYHVKAQALMNLEKYDDATEELIKSLALNEENLDAWFDVANSYRLNGEYNESLDVYNTILKRDEKSFKAFKGKALCYVGLEDYQNADNFFKKANSIKSLDDDSQEIWDDIKKNN